MLGVAGAKAEGEAAEQAAEFKAKTSMAAGTRKAYEAGREGKRLESDVRAARAAGGGAYDPGAVERQAKVGQEAEYNVLSALYEGETGADIARYEGEVKKKAAKTKGLSTMLSGGAGMYKSYKGY